MRYQKLKITVYLLLFGYLILGFFSLIYFNHQYTALHNERLGDILKLIQTKYPEVKTSELAQVLNAPSANFDLSAYGIDANSSIVNTTEIDYRQRLFLLIYCLGLLLIFFAINFYRSRQIKSNIILLLKDLENINRGFYNLEFASSENNFSLLQNELYKTSLRLKQQSNIEQSLRHQLRTNIENLSHQIKTPLTAINLLLDNLSEPNLGSQDRKKLLSQLQLEVRTATDLILLLLKLSKFDSGTVKFTPKVIKLEALLSEIEEILHPFIIEHHAELEYQNCDIEFIGDIFWEREAFLNLIHNAIQHSDGKPILIKARSTNAYQEITIKNSLPIASNIDLNHIFDRFYSGELAKNNFGLGLSLAHAVVEADNGKFRVFSDLSGTTFRLRYYRSII